MKFGEYEVIRPLGKGGMSEVYEVENVRLGSRHALKLFTYEKDDVGVRERFLAEGKLLARLNHPRIVKVIDYGTDEESGRPYFVMDLVRDEHGQVRSLADVQPGMVDEETVGRWYDDLRDGLGYIHGNGVIHRDLKLQNVLIGPDGHVVLTDFGISKVFDVKGDGNKIVDTLNTIVKMREGRSLVMGSVGYMAPELEMGVAASRESDLYALGVIVYRLLTGTWCDARTDVVSALDTYDSVWTRIIPKLLHANPQGRECLSYADEKRVAIERREFELEERWMNEKRRGHVARHLARWFAAVILVMGGVLTTIVVRNNIERRLWRAESRMIGSGRSLYDFDDFFKVPANAKAEEQTDAKGEITVPSRAELSKARIDLLVLTRDVFSALRSGNMTIEDAVVALEKLYQALDPDADQVFDGWPDDYMQISNDETDRWLLNVGIEAMKRLSEQ